MTDTPDMATQPQEPASNIPQGPSLGVINQYIKDLSFENPGIELKQQPNIELGIDVGANPKDPSKDIYEVVLKMQARAGAEEQTLFLVELDYAGLFRVNGFSPEQLEQVLLIECPRLLFPFARRIISDVSAEGGFPPLRLEPVDFAGLYQQQKARAAAAASHAPD
ncbi:MAG: protein-export chaperone SecB [Pseudomonadota bacterium]